MNGIKFSENIPRGGTVHKADASFFGPCNQNRVISQVGYWVRILFVVLLLIITLASGGAGESRVSLSLSRGVECALACSEEESKTHGH